MFDSRQEPTPIFSLNYCKEVTFLPGSQNLRWNHFENFPHNSRVVRVRKLYYFNRRNFVLWLQNGSESAGKLSTRTWRFFTA